MSWTNQVRNKAVLQRAKEERNIPQTIKKKGRLTGFVTSCIGTAP